MRLAVLTLFLTTLGIVHAKASEGNEAYAGPPQFEAIQWHQSIPQAEEPKPILLYFTTQGCVYCTKMNDGTLSHRDVVRRVGKNFWAIKLDGRKHAELVKRLQVQYYPTTAIVHPSGTVVDVIPGYVTPQDFLNRLVHAQRKLDYQSKLLAAKRREPLQ